MAPKQFKAKISVAGVTGSFEVTANATNTHQAKQIIEAQEGKVKT